MAPVKTNVPLCLMPLLENSMNLVRVPLFDEPKKGNHEELMNQLRVVKLEPFDMLVLLFDRITVRG